MLSRQWVEHTHHNCADVIAQSLRQDYAICYSPIFALVKISFPAQALPAKTALVWLAPWVGQRMPVAPNLSNDQLHVRCQVPPLLQIAANPVSAAKGQMGHDGIATSPLNVQDAQQAQVHVDHTHLL